ncbi:PREDICTED: uncharacterized protein LOC109589891 [Amphimedon queenslandica]|uniref:Uncharacterized protein n=1 Tax=Amphimedon queenslandica TaxID=400682 RepID=A0AAN0JX06_AMPQE|nr:PREDICTED: uncharacterized protein LOC109589891 [Amphimedon queenslandica]|eukprot:XP_019861439.1 PREDICTED: uncharacterized protein LOC109589891 [Amphimedon queenslandica]
MRKSKHEIQTSEKLEAKVEQNEKPKFSVLELCKKFESQDNESDLKPTSTSSSADKRFSSQLDDVTVSPRHEPNKSPAPSRRPPQPPPKPHRIKPQNEVERRPRSAAFSMRDKDELQSKLSVCFCEENHSSLLSQESTANQESTEENIANEDSPEIIECEVAPEEGTLDEGDIQMCEAPNENTPCEDTPPNEGINPKENDSNETAVVKAGIEANVSFNGLQNQPLFISNEYATEVSINAVEKRFGRHVAEAFGIALLYMKKPGQWFVKVIKKKNRKSIKSN